LTTVADGSDSVNITLKWAVAKQGCQMAYFQTKKCNLGKFWRVLLCMEDVGIFYGHMV
jgi:hypothetical protein